MAVQSLTFGQYVLLVLKDLQDEYEEGEIMLPDDDPNGDMMTELHKMFEAGTLVSAAVEVIHTQFGFDGPDPYAEPEEKGPPSPLNPWNPR